MIITTIVIIIIGSALHHYHWHHYHHRPFNCTHLTQIQICDLIGEDLVISQSLIWLFKGFESSLLIKSGSMILKISFAKEKGNMMFTRKFPEERHNLDFYWKWFNKWKNSATFQNIPNIGISMWLAWFSTESVILNLICDFPTLRWTQLILQQISDWLLFHSAPIPIQCYEYIYSIAKVK